MRKLLASVGMAVALGTIPVGCSTLTPSAPAETATFSRLVIDADAAFIAGATTLNELEAAGKLTGANRTTAEGLRVQAHNALVALRAVADARRTPDPASFYAALAQLNTFIGGFK